MNIRPVRNEDAQSICEIYNYYVENSVITFEEASVSERNMRQRIQDIKRSLLPWLVVEDSDQVLGYSYATEWRARSAYRFSVEITIYLHHKFTSNGIGSRLYKSLFEALQKTEVRAVIAGIAIPNAASIALHEKLGMEKVAHFKNVGYKFGKWIDVAYWELELNVS